MQAYRMNVLPSVWVQHYPTQSQIRTHLLSIIPQTAMGPLYTSTPHILHTHIHVHMHTPPRGFLPHFLSLFSPFIFCLQCIVLLNLFDYQIFCKLATFSLLSFYSSLISPASRKWIASLQKAFINPQSHVKNCFWWIDTLFWGFKI